MFLNELVSMHPKDRKRKGRGQGSGLGKTAGRGMKGQYARNTVARGFEGGQTPLRFKIPKIGMGKFGGRRKTLYHSLSFLSLYSSLKKNFEQGNKSSIIEKNIINKFLSKEYRAIKIILDRELVGCDIKQPLVDDIKSVFSKVTVLEFHDFSKGVRGFLDHHKIKVQLKALKVEKEVKE